MHHLNQSPILRFPISLAFWRAFPLVSKDLGGSAARKNVAFFGVSLAFFFSSKNREWPRYCRKVYWTKMDQNGLNDHFGQNALIPNWVLAFARPKWTKMVHSGPFWPEEVHFGPFRPANRTLASPEKKARVGGSGNFNLD